MKAPFSEYLNEITLPLQELIRTLNKTYDYVSILATDCSGLEVRVSRYAKSVTSDTLTSERGIVVRLCKDHQYFEYAWNDYHPEDNDAIVEKILEESTAQWQTLENVQQEIYKTNILDDEPLVFFVEKECEILPEEMNIKEFVKDLTDISKEALERSEEVIDCYVNAQCTHVNKMFLTKNRYLRQSYVFSEGIIMAAVLRDEQTQLAYQGLSGCCGPEIFKGLKDLLPDVLDNAFALLDAEPMVPGEYDIITTPEISGLLAHEAFGHGVEMDMFVKERALGKDYIGKRVGSDLVSMREGALSAEDVSSYVFDDEGVLGQDTLEIENGILKTGICDALAAVRLDVKPTGNGKRENYAHKAYTRMTNTIFDRGEDDLEDMIKSIDYGFLLDGMESGMEDPKHWGIQCIIKMGREIKDGKLTGKIFAPIIMTGYVPDVLGSISMVSKDLEVYGNGFCGKGYKEIVKVSDGGPYLKTKARLG